MVRARVNIPILNSHYFANYKAKIILQIIFNEYKIHQISNVIRFTMQERIKDHLVRFVTVEYVSLI